MRGFEELYDKLLLAVGVLLMGLLWVHVPSTPSRDRQHYAVYKNSEDESSTTAKWSYLRPSKALSARQVIRIQLQALQQNDQSDSGVITVFNFSSPSNKMRIGPLNHFRLLVRDPAYSPMLNFKSYKTGQLIITDSTAYQLVVITDQDDRQTAYLFILTKQGKGTYKGCWMTSGVARMESGPESNFT